VPRLHLPADERLTPLREVPAAGRALLGYRDHGAELAHQGPLLEVEGLRKVYRIRKSGWFDHAAKENLAVDDVSFTIARGESFGLVGESGCGKTTVSKAIMRAVSTDASRGLFETRRGA
jgi:peptide/nickel transport system ATP-binding protein